MGVRGELLRLMATYWREHSTLYTVAGIGAESVESSKTILTLDNSSLGGF